jgi:NAD(P)-dependent dehydrogenase (short-subunit alcohol dehydrogenase family)
MNINLKGVWMCMKYQIPAMLKHGKGAIVNISSVYGFKPSDVGHAAYCTSKYGVIGLSKTAAIDYAQQGIRVNVVSPGYTHSEMVDPAVEAFPELMKTAVTPVFRSKPPWRLRRDGGGDHLVMFGCGKVCKWRRPRRRRRRHITPVLTTAGGYPLRFARALTQDA